MPKVFKNKLYALIDPQNRSIRYVGRTCKSLKIRLSNHISEAKNCKQKTHRYDWICSLLSKNVIPEIQLIDDSFSSLENCAEGEKFLIQFYKELGLNLVNGTLGGEGGGAFLNKKHTDDWKNKQSIRKTGCNNHFFGKNLSDEHREKISNSLLGKLKSQEHKDSMKNRIPWNKGLTKADPRVANNYINRGLNKNG